MKISEDEILKLLEEHTTFGPHEIDPKLRVSKWGSIVETRRFLDFAKAVIAVANTRSSDQSKLESLLKSYKIPYEVFESNRRRFVRPSGKVRKMFLGKGQKHEFIFDLNGHFIKYHVLKVQYG